MKTGRPRQQLNKDIVKHVRYTSEEWEQVESKAKESGMKTSEFIRKATFNVSINQVKTLSQEEIDAYQKLCDTKAELVRIGKNINVIARNSGAKMNPIEFDKYLKDLRNCRDIAKELSAELNKIMDAIR